MKYFCPMEKFNVLQAIIAERRSIKPAVFNGKRIEDHEIRQLLVLANWAPTHGFTEPWRFIVYENPADFCAQHAEVYKQNSMGDNFNATVYTNLQHQGDKASHIIVAVMKRGDLPKIPPFEEIAAVIVRAYSSCSPSKTVR